MKTDLLYDQSPNAKIFKCQYNGYCSADADTDDVDGGYCFMLEFFE